MKMKKVILFQVLVLLSTSLMAQNQKPAQTTAKPQTKTQQPAKGQAKTNQPPVNVLGNHFAQKYSIASRWNDPDVAKDALYDLIVEYPSSDSLIFALALYYYENQKYPSAVIISQDLLTRTPKNPQVLELAANGFEGLNLFDKALQNFESLYLITNNSATLYKMAFLQYELKRYEESVTNADILLAKSDADSLKVVFNDAANKEKEYPM